MFLDLLIFLRSGSITKPLIIDRTQGSELFSKCARTTRENSQVRMISCAWVFRSIGKVSSNRSGSRSQPQTICGLSEEVAQVSITSGSAMNPPGTSRCASV